MRVIVGSQNPIKIEAVATACEALWRDAAHEVTGFAAESGISSQPMSDDEAIEGARNRARHALSNSTGADFAVGLEGTLHRVGEHYFDCCWVVVLDREGREGIGSTAKILTPPRIVALMEAEGLELGEANDRIFGATNSKQAEGHFGLMTGNAITRAQAYRDGVIVALSRFLHPELF